MASATEPGVRAHDRQPRRGHGRARRRLGRPDRRGARAGPLLGDPRRGRQLRRRHVVLVPLPSAHERSRGPGALRPRRRGRRHALVRRLHASAPDELGGWFAFLSVPPGPPFPEELHLRKVAPSSGRRPGEEESDALREARSFGKPLLDGVAPMPFPVWNTAFDARLPAGRPVVLARRVLRGDPDEAIDVHAEWRRRCRRGSRRCTCTRSTAPPRGSGTTRRRGRTGTRAGAGRRGRRSGSGECGRDPDWARGYSDAHQAVRHGGRLLNFQMDEPDRVRGMYGANYDRLARVKAQYDPDNVFSVNQNIAPRRVARRGRGRARRRPAARSSRSS